MTERQIGLRRHLQPDSLSTIAFVCPALGSAFLATAILLFMAERPAGAQEFCRQLVDFFGPCAPTVNPDSGISGSTQRQIQQRLNFLRCESSDDPACGGPGGASVDSVSYAGLSIFISADYEHKAYSAA
jgi:hypothetical protein